MSETTATALRGWRVDRRRREFRRVAGRGPRTVIPFDSPRAKPLTAALWARERAIPRIPRDAWWTARLVNLLIEHYGQWLEADLIDYVTPHSMWLLRAVY